MLRIDGCDPLKSARYCPIIRSLHLRLNHQTGLQEILRYFRKDGHIWRKKKDGKRVKEAHEKLKVGSVDVLHCYYAHGEENENFQRRTYRLLEEGFMNIVLLHYLDIKMSESEENIETQESAASSSSAQPMEVEMDNGSGDVQSEKGNEDIGKGKRKGKDDVGKRKEVSSRSEMWQHFAKVKVDDVVMKGDCNYCHTEIAAHPVHNGTSALHKHFNLCKCNPHKNNGDKKKDTLQVGQGESVHTWKFGTECIRAAFAEMIIEDELPFAFGENSGFRKFMAKACPHFSIPSRRTCARDVVRSYFEQKANLKHFFKESCERACLTTSCWTSQQQDSYMVVTAHFIDKDWKLHKKIISFFKVKGHRGDDIGKHLHTTLMEWGIDKVMTISVDDASSNDGGISYMKKQMNNAKTSIAEGKYLHMSCATHIVNLIVSDGLKEVDNSIKRVRAAIRYVQNDTNRLEKFKDSADFEKVDTKALLNLDICTRWNSTYLMLKAAITYKKVFVKYAEEDPYYTIDLLSNKSPGVPDETDWENAKNMADFLGHFFDLTTRVSASLNVTANSFLHEIGEIGLLVRTWMDSDDALQRAIGKKMKGKYDKYWGNWHDNDKVKGKGKERGEANINLLILIAAGLDPRYKLSEYTQFPIEEMYDEEKGPKVWAAINTCFRELFEEYKVLYAPSNVVTQEKDEAHEAEAIGGRASLMKSLIAKKMKLNSGGSRNSRSELDKYLAEEMEDDDPKFDILSWWKVNSSRFPVLSCLARDVLAIPISTVASESAFFSGGRVLDDFRTSLTPFMVQAIICTQDWLRHTTPINIEENMEELAKLEKDISLGQMLV
uniref:Uncharacterized protein n=1 Tax=Avena sativa TaxID=4498 RepID=A0ACD5UTV8_AVESA